MDPNGAFSEGIGNLYDSLNAAFPPGLLQESLQHTIMGKVRKRLRDVGYRVVFPPGEEWQAVLEAFTVAALDRLYRSFGENPWFWVVGWPTVFGAAASDFFPTVGDPFERRRVAFDMASAHLEALLLRRALGEGEKAGALPAPAAKGLRVIGQSTLPGLDKPAMEPVEQIAVASGVPAAPEPEPRRALPTPTPPPPAALPAHEEPRAVSNPWTQRPPPSPQSPSQGSSTSAEPMTPPPGAVGGAIWKATQPLPPFPIPTSAQASLAAVLGSTAPLSTPLPAAVPPPPSARSLATGAVPPPPPLAAKVAEVQPQAAARVQPAHAPAPAPVPAPVLSQPPVVRAPAPAPASLGSVGPSGKDIRCRCRSVMAMTKASAQIYGKENNVICDECGVSCGQGDADATAPHFYHCAQCKYDLCASCGKGQALQPVPLD